MKEKKTMISNSGISSMVCKAFWSKEGRGGIGSPALATSQTVGEITTFWLGFALGAFAPAAFLAGAWCKEALLWMIP